MSRHAIVPIVAATVIAMSSSTALHGQRTAAAPVPPAAADANPFFAPSPLSFEAPPFDKIKDSDFKPALEEGMRRQLIEVNAIADSTDPPTFDNTIMALERAGELLTRVSLVFNGLTGANTNDELQKVQEEEAPKLAASQDAIYLNSKLFTRVESVYTHRHEFHLDPESIRLAEYDYQQFVLAGAKLSETEKDKLKKLNEEDATLSAKYVNELLAAAKAGALVAGDKSELDGLSAGEIEAAALAAKSRGLDGKWMLPLQNTTQQPALGSLVNRATREKLFNASWTRAEHGDANDTRATIARLAQLRADEATLLGYPSYAAWKLQNQMAKTPAAVFAFMDKLVPAATVRARTEAADIQKVIDAQHGGFALKPWDWNFYAEQVRKAKYDLDTAAIKPYFELNTVLQDGVFYAAHQLYGLSFTERKDLPVYQKDVRAFEVSDKKGAPVGLFYCDYFKRDNKSGGAWMDNFVLQSKLLGTKPVIYNVANFAPPAPGQPALLSMDDVITMFHEFGHALHGLMADQDYPSISGSNTARDFVEFPSQFNEHWALESSVFAHYARHYQTGAAMPRDLVNKIVKARAFNAGYDMTELLAAAELDMQWFTLQARAPLPDVDAFETAALKKTHVDVPQVPTRYRSSYFLHIWGNGYAAGYYAYLWTQMLADDAYAWFAAHGGLTAENGERFRKMVLSRGNTLDYGVMYRNFTGHDPEIGPMLKYRGLDGR
jgi:peptidyl-dipeptidase Dcp